ncbi:PREDICTED: acrosomal protein SP-10 [Elephantulus edwardii]|uniref:acrosomal protein SP-10 n=1 Tax=Elephantulus edwardii TaxID=28737 RepID=UPI0003F0A3CB|nr:PREDICTED: acrosomal protein SP-10 [Elephantulus edwardii]
MKFLLLIYLIGFAREASGQPDEPLSPINQQASIQQLPGKYFSLVKPSDVEALYESSSGEHSSSEHASEHSSGENSTEQQTSSDHPLAEQSSDETLSGETPLGEKSAGEKTSGEKVSSEQASGEKSLDEKASSEKAPSEQTSGEQSSGENSLSEQPPGGSTLGEPSTEKPSSEPSLGTLSSIASSSGTGLNCHTCSYMNEQGKCLRGEGVCTTQNSQQCMLKKIFEGGKLQFIVQGCENMCPSMNLFSHGTRMQIICCRNQSFCNKI